MAEPEKDASSTAASRWQETLMKLGSSKERRKVQHILHSKDPIDVKMKRISEELGRTTFTRAEVKSLAEMYLLEIAEAETHRRKRWGLMCMTFLMMGVAVGMCAAAIQFMKESTVSVTTGQQASASLVEKRSPLSSGGGAERILQTAEALVDIELSLCLDRDDDGTYLLSDDDLQSIVHVTWMEDEQLVESTGQWHGTFFSSHVVGVERGKDDELILDLARGSQVSLSKDTDGADATPYEVYFRERPDLPWREILDEADEDDTGRGRALVSLRRYDLSDKFESKWAVKFDNYF